MRRQEEKLVQLLQEEQGREGKLRYLKREINKIRTQINYEEATNWLEKNLYIAVIH